MLSEPGPRADLRGRDLRGASLRGANLKGADLRDADLRGVDLEGADLRGADIRGARTTGANLRGVRLPHERVDPGQGCLDEWQYHVVWEGECLIWRGNTNNNHNGTDGKSYDYGVFRLEGCESPAVHRQVYFIATGRDLPRDFDVTPLCGNHLCVRSEHLGVVPREVRKDRSAEAVPMVDFFEE